MSRIASPLAFAIALALAATPIALSALSAAAAPELSAADGDITWSVEPIQTSDGVRRAFEYSVDPGTQIVDSMVITNSGTTSAEFLIYATDAINELDTGAFGLLERKDKPTDVGAWITTGSDKLTIDPGMQAIVPFNLLVPSDATPGEHVAGVVAAVLTKGTSDGAAVELEQRVGARVYLTVSGAAEAAVEVEGLGSGFNPQLNPFAAGDLDLGYTVRNSGNLRVEVQQQVVVSSWFGMELGRFEPEPIMELLPRQSVHVESNIPSILALLFTVSTVTLTPGPVGATALVPTADDAEVTDTAETTPTPSATPAEDEAFVDEATIEYNPASENTLALAISWTMFILVLVLLALIYFGWRYVAGTRERMYLAIDEAAEAARAEAAAEARENTKVGG